MEKKSIKVHFYDWEIDFWVTFNGVKTYGGKKLKKNPEDWNSILSKVFCRINTNLKDQEIFKNKKEGKGQRITHCFSSEFSSDSMTERASSFLVNFCHCHGFFFPFFSLSTIPFLHSSNFVWTIVDSQNFRSGMQAA